MKVVRPFVIDDTKLISSSAPENEYALYAPATNYALNARVIYSHVIYESIQSPNTGNTPATSPLYWAVISATNRWLMFDQEVSSFTAIASPLAVVVAPGALFDSLALLDVQGAAVSISITDGLGGPVIYEYEARLDGSEVFDWYQYFYQPFIPVYQVVLTGLPLYGSAHVSASITGAGTIQCGSMILGTAFELGDTRFGVSVGITDYSRKDTSALGVTTLLRRKFSKRMSAPLMFDNFQLSKVYRVLADLRATPCVWIGTDVAGYDPLTVFGFYRDFSIDIPYPTASYCSLEIEGMT